MRYLLLLVVFFFCSCSGSSEKPRPDAWKGMWNARWNTPPEAYPGIADMVFTMNGSFHFTEDSLTVQANGFEGCIFNADTLAHTQTWYVMNDTLFLQNDPEMPGMTYQVNSITTNTIELQLMDDIYVTLTKE